MAVSLAQSIRQSSARHENIVAFLGANRPTCVERALNALSVVTRNASELLDGLPVLQRARSLGAQWHKEGISWNAFMRHNYDRVLFLDADQFVNRDVGPIMRQRLPAGVAIAMCPMPCSGHFALRTVGSDRSSAKQPGKCPCLLESVPGANETAVGACPVQGGSCCGGVRGENQILLNSKAIRAHLAHFYGIYPAKPVSYSSHAWLLDLSKLPPPAETLDAARRSLALTPYDWMDGFTRGDQAWIELLFYDAIAILPECSTEASAPWAHVFHTHTEAMLEPFWRKRAHETRSDGAHKTRFRALYADATGSPAVCDRQEEYAAAMQRADAVAVTHRILAAVAGVVALSMVGAIIWCPHRWGLGSPTE